MRCSRETLEIIVMKSLMLKRIFPNTIASRKLKFRLRRIACAMAKTKAMCIINRTDKLIGIQHEKKHGKGSK